MRAFDGAGTEPLDLAVERDEGRARVLVRGEVDAATAPQLRSVLRALVANGASELVIDLRDVGFLDSAGIDVLVEISDATLAVAVAAPSELVRRVLASAQVDAVLRVQP